jgi:hypothetical protein
MLESPLMPVSPILKAITVLVFSTELRSLYSNGVKPQAMSVLVLYDFMLLILLCVGMLQHILPFSVY